MAVAVDRAVVEELKEKIALGCRILGKLGLSDYLGHISARVPGTEYVLIKPSGLDHGSLTKMTADKVVMVDYDGHRVEGTTRPPGETMLHLEILRARPDVGAVVHTHQPLATVFGDQEKPILPMQGVMAAVVARPIPIYRSSRKVMTREQGAEVARTLGDHPAVHLKNHGVVTVGASVEEAVINAIWLEHQAKLTLWGHLLGTPRGMDPAELPYQFSEAEPLTGRWNYYVSLLDE
ncbi:MAG: class II aldolase/adducin family protein [Firmicutes bacterium]|nr:class II aldolase/adducin family protein [Bacillota bacterium]